MTAAATRIVLPPSSNRSPDAEVDAQFVERWSRRAISERPLSSAQIQSLFEAARWAPSANNFQPWLFVYASQPESLARARELLVPTNQRWANRAPLLVFVFARKRHPETLAPLRTAAFDTGAAWQSLALQAHKLGLSTRARSCLLTCTRKSSPTRARRPKSLLSRGATPYLEYGVLICQLRHRSCACARPGGRRRADIERSPRSTSLRVVRHFGRRGVELGQADRSHARSSRHRSRNSGTGSA